MENTLMELVNDCDKAEKFTYVNKAKDKIAELNDLGFYDLAQELSKKVSLKERLSIIGELGYINITEEKIVKFLDAKVERYNNAHKPKIETSPYLTGSAFATGAFEQLYARYVAQHYGRQNIPVTEPYFEASKCVINRTTVHSSTTRPGTIGKFEWKEVYSDNYKKLPPSHVLKSFAEAKAKKLFDYFTIASVNEVVDPLLLGRLHGSNNRYFIAQWGDDVALDDLI